MFCIKCGVQNLDDADFCFKCGKPLIKAEEQTVVKQNVSQGFPGVETICTTPGAPALQFPTASSINKWVIAYGWLFIAAGLALICIGITQKNTYRLVADFFQTWLFCTTGVAILLRKKSAPALVWITVALSALGVLFRGATALEILQWYNGVGPCQVAEGLADVYRKGLNFGLRVPISPGKMTVEGIHG